MIDGIHIDIPILDFESWKASMPFSVTTPYDTYANEIISTSGIDKKTGINYMTVVHTAKFQTYDIIIKEVSYPYNPDLPTRYNLKIKGSLHKNKFNGTNYARFYFTDVCEEINKLCAALMIDIKQAKISNLEFGVNIEVGFQPFSFLQNYLINYKHKIFTQYEPDNEGRCLGYFCKYGQYLVKCYDKGLQNNLSSNLMRYELKYKKMQKLNNQFGIKYLYDLTQPEKIYELKKLLLQTWKHVLLYEELTIPNELLNSTQKKLVIQGNNQRYWEGLKKINVRRMRYHSGVIKKLFKNYGKGYHADIYNKISSEWELLYNLNLLDFTNLVNGNKLQLI